MMFHDIPQPVIDRMRYLEERDAQDRREGAPTEQRLRQVPAETGKLLALLAASAPQGHFLEVGTSGGYSGLWIALACRERGAHGWRNARLTTFEMLEHKAQLAEETFQLSGLESYVQVVRGDARQHLAAYEQVAFCFLDCEKEYFLPCYEAVVPNLVPGGWLLADNAVSHAAELDTFLRTVQEDARLDSLVVPIGKGVLICRRV
jgi:predicted O-methyltransferase YrrM